MLILKDLRPRKEAGALTSPAKINTQKRRQGRGEVLRPNPCHIDAPEGNRRALAGARSRIYCVSLLAETASGIESFNPGK